MKRVTRRLFAVTTLAAGLTLAALPASAAQPADVTAAQHDQDPGRRLPRAVQQWANAWNTRDAKAMGALFTDDGTYTDHAFQVTDTGPAGAQRWVETTMIAFTKADATVKNAFLSGDNIAVTWTFTGTFSDKASVFAPYNPVGKSFSVPATTVITMCGDHVKSIEDYYNLADVLRQVGLPAGPYTPASTS